MPCAMSLKWENSMRRTAVKELEFVKPECHLRYREGKYIQKRHSYLRLVEGLGVCLSLVREIIIS